MNRVSIDLERRIARAEAGALWAGRGPAAPSAAWPSLHGSSPDVGVAGYSLGGGVGWLARLHGLQCNSLTAVELVTADGEHVRADADHEPELFWALRGGGGNFGAVTALEFRLYPIERVYAGSLIWPWEDAQRVLHRWAEWTRTAPEEVMSVAHIRQLPDLDVIPEPRPRPRHRDPPGRVRRRRGARPRAAAPAARARAGDGHLRGAARRPHAAGRRPRGPDARLRHARALAAAPDAVDAFVALTGPGSRSVLIANEIRHLGGALGRQAPAAARCRTSTRRSWCS